MWAHSERMPWNNSDMCKVHNQGHNTNKCTSTEIKCYHCEADHQAFSNNCPIFERETELIQIQTKERIPRLQAIRKLLRLNPNPGVIFSNAVKNTPNPTRSKSPIRSEQESQSDPSEDTNVTLKFYENLRMKKTAQRLYRPTSTGTILRKKEKRKRSPPSPPLTVRVKRPRK